MSENSRPNRPNRPNHSESSTKIIQISGRGIPLRGNDIDTDRIIPARFLKTITFNDLTDKAFYDERGENSEKEHPFDSASYKGSSVLIVNKNFGCGSSREHAPQALMRSGIKVIIGESFAEIFAGNCTMIGIPVVTVTEAQTRFLQIIVTIYPETIISVDLDNKIIKQDHNHFKLNIHDTDRFLFLEGKWDSTQILLENKDKIKATAGNLPYTKW